MNIKKALVVDDSKVAHLTLRKLLLERGIEVDWVGSGEDCIKYLETKKPDIIFMDVMMPGMDGFETSRAITWTASGCFSHHHVLRQRHRRGQAGRQGKRRGRVSLQTLHPGPTGRGHANGQRGHRSHFHGRNRRRPATADPHAVRGRKTDAGPRRARKSGRQSEAPIRVPAGTPTEASQRQSNKSPNASPGPPPRRWPATSFRNWCPI
jgi:hypothetical protein